MRIQRFGNFIAPDTFLQRPSVPTVAAAGFSAGMIAVFGLAMLVLMNSSKRKRNGTSERGSVMAVSGERRNPSTRTRTEVRSPTSTRTEVRSPTSTSTSTRAHTSGNFTATVTGGAGAGATNVTIRRNRRNRRK